MTFGEAIRVGAAMRPQAFGSVWSHNETDGRIGSCVLGAAYEGLYGSQGIAPICLSTVFREAFPGIRRETVCPVQAPCWFKAGPMLSMAAHLNDDHRWTRERIADWADEVLG